MSILDDVWDGSVEDELEDENEVVDEQPIIILDDSIFYEPQMRWNENKNENRVKECWVCGEETNSFFAHRWRIKKGYITNIKCKKCFYEYKKRLADAKDRKRGQDI